MTQQAKTGDKVKVHYTGKLDDGTVFDSSTDRSPLEFKIGEGRIIPGFEKAVVGMQPGESKDETIPAEHAYGPRRDELMIQVDREEIPADINIEVGQHLQVTHPDGQEIPVMVQGVTETTVTLDANHPLAGKELTFDIQLIGIV